MPPALLRSLGILLMTLPASFVSGQLIVAHRGASHDAPENTIAAFKLAWEQGADGIEGDFYLSSDGHIVCIHDENTKRTSNKNLVVAKSTLAELRALDAGSWKDKKWQGERIPVLGEVLATIPDGKKIFIELKTGPEIVKPLVQSLSKSRVKPSQIVIICFNKDTVAACAEQLPQIKTQWLTGYEKNDDLVGKWTPSAESVIKTIQEIGATGLGSEANRKHVDASFIKKLHEAGIQELGLWTVNDPKIAIFYRALGAVAITTNRPGWLREQMDCKSSETP